MQVHTLRGLGVSFNAAGARLRRLCALAQYVDNVQLDMPWQTVVCLSKFRQQFLRSADITVHRISPIWQPVWLPS